MKSLRLLSLVLLVSPFVFISCDKDDPEPDPVQQAEGTYNYKTKMYYLDGTNLEYLGASLDGAGTAILTKTTTGFEVKEGGEVTFKGAKVAKASNGFTFDIETQTLDFGGQDVTVEGYDGATLEGLKYNGLYLTASKELTGYLQFEGVLIDEDDNEFEVTFVIEFIATKA